MSHSNLNERVVILDRDGTVVVDRGYLADAAGLEFAPTAADALRLLHSHGYRLVVVTNQSGVGRGLFPLERVHEMNTRLQAMFDTAGAHLEGIYVCPHAPDEGCRCRKPAQGLMTDAAAELSFDPARAVVIGDRESDIEFGKIAGAQTILIAAQGRSPGALIQPDGVAADLLSAARAVISADLSASGAA